MAESEQRRELAESLRDVVQNPGRSAGDMRADAKAARTIVSARRRRTVLGLLAASWALLAWLWLAKPDIVFSPPLRLTSTPTLPPEAGLRYGLYLQAARIREFQAANGRLPISIAEAGEAEEGLRYLRESTGWSLHATLNGQELVLTSQMSADSFLTTLSPQP